MGADIHMSIVKNNRYLAKNIYNGRNSEWFDNLQGEGWKDEYNELPIKYGYSNQTPENYKEKYNENNYYYGFRYINVGDFKNWFIKYRPDKDAGWVTTYEKWKIENKRWVPDDVKHYLDKEDNIDDMHFIEFENPYDCSKWLYDYCIKHHISNKADIIYCFDC